MKTEGFDSILERKPEKCAHMTDEQWLKYYIGVGVCNSLNAEAVALQVADTTILLNPKIKNDVSNLMSRSQELITLMEHRIEELERELEEWKRL